jgi:hypothetical protein
VQEHARVEVAGARPHHQSLERRHSHAGLDAAAVFDGRDARSIAEVARDDAQLLRGPAQELRGGAQHVCVADAVEPVAADAPAIAQRARQRVVARARWQRRVEGGVEHRHVRQREARAGGAQRGQCRRIV